jgi:16S rRNA (cytosine967-C5)-methyltransferase
LVYAVCSLDRREGRDRVAAFLARHKDFARAPLRADELGGHAEWIDDAGDLATDPTHGMDGFHAARLRRAGG